MATKSYQEQLEEVQTAISAVMDGQSFNIISADGSQWQVTRADLSKLHDRELMLRGLVDREARGGLRVQRITPH